MDRMPLEVENAKLRQLIRRARIYMSSRIRQDAKAAEGAGLHLAAAHMKALEAELRMHEAKD